MATRFNSGLFAILVFVFLSNFVLANAEDDADDLHRKGIAALKESQEKPDAIVVAARYFAKASALYEARGKAADAVEMNSYLYWCKKKMTLADIDAFLKSEDPTVVAQLTAVESKSARPSDAQSWLDRADAFARANPGEHLLAAVRFFEVADRFKDTDAGRVAIGKSLAEMQQIGAQKAKVDAYKPAVTDGKAFIKSDPPGAAIYLVAADGRKMDLGKVTPALVQIPVGNQTLELALKGYKSTLLQVIVSDQSITKPDVSKLEPVTVPIDIIFQEGWKVFIDGQLYKSDKGGKAETPCTVLFPLGRHELGLAKPDFMDIQQKLVIVEDGVKGMGVAPIKNLEITSKPRKGTSRLMTVDLLALLDPRKNTLVSRGKWQVFPDHLVSDNGVRGFVQFPYHPPEEYDFNVEFSMQRSRFVLFVLPGSNSQFAFVIGASGKTAGFEMVSGNLAEANQTGKPFTITQNRRYKAKIEVRRTGVAAYIDDQLISELKTDFKNLSLYFQWTTPDPHAFAVTNDEVVTTYYSISAVEVSGSGEVIRSNP